MTQNQSTRRKVLQEEMVVFLPAIVLYATILSSILGIATGLISILRNQYLTHSFYLAVDDLTHSLNRHLYVFALSAIVFFLLLMGLRIVINRPIRLILYALAFLALCTLVNVYDLDHRVHVVWKELGLVMKLGLAIFLLVNIDIIMGRQWSIRCSRGASLTTVLAILAVPLTFNLASLIWFTTLQKALSDKPNIIILVVDALRADHVACLGYDRHTTPTIDAIASEGVMFTQAVSNSNATRFTVPSLFTFLFPSVHGITVDGNVLAPRFLTLAEILKSLGYATAAHMPNPSLKRRFRFDQGFDVYDDQVLNQRYPGMSRFEKYETAQRINTRVLKWLERNRDNRVFLYIHYRDVHAPYVPPPPYDTLYYGGDTSERERNISENEYRRMPNNHELEHDHNDLNYYLAQYDGEIRYVDEQIHYLLARMKELGVLDNAVIFVTADHGEAFLEHGDWAHGSNLYDEMVHVPLVVRLPGQDKRNMKIESPVHTFDISATILDLLDLKPDIDMQAKSLLPLINGDRANSWEYAFVESPGKRSVRNGQWKMIQDDKEHSEELYNLQEDPSESRNVIFEEPQVARELRERIRGFVIANEMLSQGHVASREELDEETLRQLRSLGYVE